MAVDVNRIIQAAAEAALDDQASPRSQQRDGNQRKRKGLTAPRALLVGAGLATVARAATHKKFLRIAKFGVEKLVDVPNVRDLSDAVRDRLADHGLLHEDEDEQYPLDDEWDERDDDEDEDYGDDEPGDDEDAPPENEAEEDWDDEEEDEPRDEEDDEPSEEGDEEPEAEGEEEDEPRDEEDDEPSEEGDEEPEAEGEEDWDDEAEEDEVESDAPGIALGSANGDAAERAERGLDAALQSGRTRGTTPELMQLLDSPHSPPPAMRRARIEDPVKRPPQPAPRTRQDDERSKPTRRTSNSHSKSNTKKPADRKQKARRN